MKRYVWITVLLLAPLASADAVATQAATIQSRWVPCGLGPIEENGLPGGTPGFYLVGVDEPNEVQRYDAAGYGVNAMTMNIPETWNYLSFRYSGSEAAEDEEAVFLLFFCDEPYGSTNGVYLAAVKLTFVVGKQRNTKFGSAPTWGWNFADAVSAVEYIVSGTAKSPQNNYVAVYECDRKWARKVAVVCLTAPEFGGYLEWTGH